MKTTLKNVDIRDCEQVYEISLHLYHAEDDPFRWDKKSINLFKNKNNNIFQIVLSALVVLAKFPTSCSAAKAPNQNEVDLAYIFDLLDSNYTTLTVISIKMWSDLYSKKRYYQRVKRLPFMEEKCLRKKLWNYSSNWAKSIGKPFDHYSKGVQYRKIKICTSMRKKF